MENDFHWLFAISEVINNFRCFTALWFLKRFSSQCFSSFNQLQKVFSRKWVPTSKRWFTIFRKTHIYLLVYISALSVSEILKTMFLSRRGSPRSFSSGFLVSQRKKLFIVLPITQLNAVSAGQTISIIGLVQTVDNPTWWNSQWVIAFWNSQSSEKLLSLCNKAPWNLSNLFKSDAKFAKCWAYPTPDIVCFRAYSGLFSTKNFTLKFRKWTCFRFFSSSKT